jgi:protein-tyrosine phosphatase
MDRNARAELARRGYDGCAHRARQIESSWLAGRDLILAMDRHNLADLRRMAPPADRAGPGGNRVRLFGEVGGLRSAGVGGLEPAVDGLDIPDPYGGGSADFSAALDLIEAGSRRIAAQLAELLAGRTPA